MIFANGLATSRAHSIKSLTAGLRVRFFRVNNATRCGGTPSSIGSAFIDQGFAQNLSSILNNLTDSTAGPLGLDAKSLQQTSQQLGSHISDLQSNLAVKQANLILIYSQVNATLQELPLLQQQLSRQLASF